MTPAYTATGGTVTTLGTYTAGQASGSFQVIATEVGGLADTAQVAVTPSPPPSGTEIQRALFNDWTIQGNSTPGFNNMAGGPPAPPHTVGNGIYSIRPGSANGGANHQYTFGGNSYPVVVSTFQFRISGPVGGQLKGMRYSTNTTFGVPGPGLGGLFFGPIGGGDGIYFVFEGFGMALNVASGAYFGLGGADAQVTNLADGQWHTVVFTYDVGSAQRRMRLEVDSVLLSQPNGQGGNVFGQSESCSGQFGASASTWQDGWLVSCTSQPGTTIGSGLWFDSWHANSSPLIELLAPYVWSTP